MNKDNNKKQDMSIEEILKSIKGVIDSQTNMMQADNDDILELTNVVVDCTMKDKITLQEDVSDNDLAEDNILESSLVSDQSIATATNVFKQFVETVKDVKKPKVVTLENLVIEMIRPQLSKWLDENLPLLVKQLVEKEIKKLIPNDQE